MISWEQAANFAYYAAFLVCWAVTSLHGYHMFQLNSYKPAAHLKWLRRNFLRDYTVRHIFIAFVAPLSVFSADSPRTAALLSINFYIIQSRTNWPRKAKKPLAYTNRIKRMLVTDAMLTASLMVLSFYKYLPPLALPLWLLATPLITLLSNAINSPIEKSINRWYIEDAKRIIKSMPRLTVIGVTGSYGKTSTKYFLHKVLSAEFNVLMTPESYNTTLGVVRTVRTQLRPIHDIFICEMGARNQGDIKEICGIVKPKLGVITSIGPQHLESFGSIENIARTKFELADALPEDGTLFLNFDSGRVREEIRDRKANGALNVKSVISYGTSDGCDYRADCVTVSGAGSSFTAIFPDGSRRSFSTRLLGKHNVTNILAALAAADFLGTPADGAAISVGRLEAVPHRLQLIRRDDIIIIDDSYNSNENGAASALEVLAGFDGFKILVTPGMVELGSEQDSVNRRFGSRAASVCDFIVLVGKKGTGSILAGMKDVSYPDEKIFAAAGIDQAFERIRAIRAGAIKVVLIENDLPDNY
jgi:UDP-N-acetylmuramoyl-tripeptide--D-alanyl-D-alanine ligase